MKPIAISLFSGAGGMDIGMKSAGFDVRVCVEIDPSCCDTLRHNMPDTQIIEKDIQTLSGKQILEIAGIEEGNVDLVFGGPPCQSFSLVGRREGLDDPRGELVFEFIRIVNELKPKAFVLENVKGMANWGNGVVLREITKRFEQSEPSYKVNYAILNAADYGVPQNRERIFIVGNAENLNFRFPSADHNMLGYPKHTVADALGGLPPADDPSPTAMRVSATIKGRISAHGY